MGLPIEELQTAIRDLRKVSIARVQGFAIGGGNVFATLCDLTIASEKAVFRQNRSQGGLVDPGWGTALLARHVGEKKAREIWFLCRKYTTAQPRPATLGLVQQVVPHEQLDAEVEAWAASVNRMSPTALAIAKRSFNADSENIRGIGFLGIQAVKHYYAGEESKEECARSTSAASPISRNSSSAIREMAMDDRNIRTALDGDGVLVATIEMPGRSMNVFSAALMDSVERLLDLVAANAEVRAVILTSGKSAFLAGADLDMVRMFTQRARTDAPAALHALCGRLGRIFRRLEIQGKPFVAAINGLALGGGLEVALSCHERVASDGAQVGLPEIKLGLLPGAGGTQRLPRLVGQSLGLQLMLKGESRTAAQALEIGIIDVVVPAHELLNEARSRALRLADHRPAAMGRGAVARARKRSVGHEGAGADLVASLGIDAEERPPLSGL